MAPTKRVDEAGTETNTERGHLKGTGGIVTLSTLRPRRRRRDQGGGEMAAAKTSPGGVRIEEDALGDVEVPAEDLWVAAPDRSRRAFTTGVARLRREL